MSFDIFLQGFHRGEALDAGGEEARAVLAPYLASEEPEQRFLQVVTEDGSADVYLGPDHLMANHVAGEQAWELLWQVARAAGWVVMPVGAPVCLTAESQRGHLPAVLRPDAVVVGSGEHLLAVVRSA